MLRLINFEYLVKSSRDKFLYNEVSGGFFNSVS